MGNCGCGDSLAGHGNDHDLEGNQGLIRSWLWPVILYGGEVYRIC